MDVSGIEGDNSAFFNDEQKVWSKRKLRILEQYMASYVKKRGFNKTKIFYVDGFAGRGLYGLIEPFDEGSPVKIAKLSEKIRTENRNYRLHCLNSEIDPVRCDRLREALSFADQKYVKTYSGAFNSHLPTMLKEMGNHPAVFFLDPCGIVGIAPDEVKPVASRGDTEILLTLSLPTIFRMSGSITSDAPEAPGKVAQLSRVLGEDPLNLAPEWAEKKRELGTDAWAEWAVGRYMKNLQSGSGHLRYGLAYPIKGKFDSGTKYYLIFATRSMDAFPFMTDFICSEEDDLELTAEMESVAPGQLGLFAPLPEFNREQKMPEVIEQIHDYGREHQGCTRKDLIEQFSYRHLGKFKQKHFRYMITRLVDTGRAKIYNGQDRHPELDKRPITFL